MVQLFRPTHATTPLQRAQLGSEPLEVLMVGGSMDHLLLHLTSLLALICRTFVALSGIAGVPASHHFLMLISSPSVFPFFSLLPIIRGGSQTTGTSRTGNGG